MPHSRFFSLDRNIAQIEFNKSIAGCYRDGNQEYEAVGALLLTWKEDDLECKEKEVNALEKTLQSRFNYHTEQYEIPPKDSKKLLSTRLDAFLRCYDSPSKLAIIYYGGHAEKNDVGKADESDLQLFAYRTQPNMARTATSLSDVSILESPVEGKLATPLQTGPRPEQEHISFKDICEQLKTSETDILLIVDCCYAAGAYTDHIFRGRKCELFCSISENNWARAPGHPGSFTNVLTNSLEELLEENPAGFPTSDLYNRIYRKQHHNHKPFHFHQSRLDFGQIWFRPFQLKDESTPEPTRSNEIAESKYTIDVRFHLAKSIDLADLNLIVKALQWIPFVQMVKMQSMHSPADELRHFFHTVQLANRLRPLLARVRQRLDGRKARQLRKTDATPPSSPVGSTTSEKFMEKKPRNVELFDFSEATATVGKERLSLGMYDAKKPPVRLLDPRVPTERRTMVNAALQLFSRQSQTNAPVETAGSSLLSRLAGQLSQRTRDGILFFLLGVLAPKLMGWAAQGFKSSYRRGW